MSDERVTAPPGGYDLEREEEMFEVVCETLRIQATGPRVEAMNGIYVREMIAWLGHVEADLRALREARESGALNQARVALASAERRAREYHHDKTVAVCRRAGLILKNLQADARSLHKGPTP